MELLAGMMMFSTGLLGEVLMRTYFESQDRRICAIREIRSRIFRPTVHNRVGKAAVDSC